MRLRLPLVIAAAVVAFVGLYTVSRAGESEDSVRRAVAPAPLPGDPPPARLPISLGSRHATPALPSPTAAAPSTAAARAPAPAPAVAAPPTPAPRPPPAPEPAPAPDPERVPEPDPESPPSGGRSFTDVE